MLEKNVFFIFWVRILLRPKVVTDVKNSLFILGRAWEYQPKIHVQKTFIRYSHQIFYFLLFYI